MYKQMKDTITGNIVSSVFRILDGASIPADPDNTDYAQFKKDILEGAELLDADGQVMQDAIQFVKELP
jgi:hypothetical protein